MSKSGSAESKPKVLQRGLDHVGVGVGAVIHDGKGRILLMKRGSGARDEHGKWDICGGAIEFGESIDEAIRREIAEELCAEPVEVDFLTAYDAHREHNGKPTHWVQLLHAARVDPASVKIGEPHKIDEVGWFYGSSLPAPLHSQFDKNFRIARKMGIVW